MSFIKRKIIIGLLVLLCFILLSPFLWLEQKPVWQKTTKEYQANCGQECQYITQVRPGHGGPALSLIYNPEVDDPTAQWSDCIQSVMSCWREDKTFSDCVEPSSCPQECKTHFYKKLGNNKDTKKQQEAFEVIFIDEGGMCLPESRQVIGDKK